MINKYRIKIFINFGVINIFMEESTKFVESEQNSINDINDKDAIIDSIAEETGMDSDSDLLMIENAVNNLEIDQEFNDKNFNPDKKLSTSITEDIKNIITGGKVITEGTVTNIEKKTRLTKQQIEVTIDLNEVNEQFTVDFEYNEETMSERLENFFILVGVKSGNPSDLIGKDVPLTHNHIGSDRYEYEIHWPPSSGLIPKIMYKSSRFCRNKKLVSLTGNKSYDFKYKPTVRAYLIMIFGIILSTFTPVFTVFLFTLSVSLIVFTLIYSTVVVLETTDQI